MGLSSVGFAERWVEARVGNGSPPGVLFVTRPAPSQPHSKPARPLQRPHPFVSAPMPFSRYSLLASRPARRLCRSSARSPRPTAPGPRQRPAGNRRTPLSRSATTASCRRVSALHQSLLHAGAISGLQAIPAWAFQPALPERNHSLRFLRSGPR